MTPEHKDLLRERYGFMFDDSLIDDIIKHGLYRESKTGTSLIDIGDKIEFMPLILSGTIKILREDEEANELLLYYLELGDTCAMTLNCCLHGAKSNIRALTEEDSSYIMIPVSKMDEWITKYRSWRQFVFESYNTRLNEMLSAIDNLAFNNMEERLYGYLRDKAMVTKTGTLKITHHEIARELNSSRVVISRLIKKLNDSGKIDHHRNEIILKEFAPKA